jgi:hypothetical protein
MMGGAPAITLSAILALAASDCASLRAPTEDIPPLAMMVDASADSAMQLLVAALGSARLALDNGGRPFAGSMTTTYVVRNGGIGEAEVELRFRVEPESGASPGGETAVVHIHGVLRERPRRFGVGDPRDAQLRRDPQPIRGEDSEAMAPIRRIVRYLREAGARGSGRPESRGQSS